MCSVHQKIGSFTADFHLFAFILFLYHHSQMKKTILLTFISVSLLFLFFQFPRNQEWFSSRILAYWLDFISQKKHLGVEVRKKERWESSYTISKEIAGFFQKNNILKNALVLIPPSAYFEQKGINYDVPEPVVFYYYTGLKTIWINSPDTLNANWMVIADRGHYRVVSVPDKKTLSDSIESFKKYPVRL